MDTDASLHGLLRDQWEPEWGPLEALLGSDDLCGHFMWMFDVELDDGTILNAYKHRWTRAYLHLSAAGDAYWYAGEDRYWRVEPACAIEWVFDRWEICDPTEVERAALVEALRRASDAEGGEAAW